MEKLFEIETPYTYETYKELNEFHFSSRKRGNKIFLIMLSIIIVLCGILLIFLKSYPMGIVYTILGIFFLVWAYVAPKIATKVMSKSDKMLDNLINTDTFYDEYFENTNEQSNAKIFYNQLYDAYEAKDYFYLYVNRRSAYIISKNGFKEGTSENFREFLQEKLKERFKIKI